VATITWRITPDIAHRFNNLCHQLQKTDIHSTEYRDLVDEIRRLPRFPTGWDERNDTISIDLIGPRAMIEVPTRWKPSPA
jgi:hypothetical protein